MQTISLLASCSHRIFLLDGPSSKKYQVNMVLFLAGFLLNVLALFNGTSDFLPKNATPTGLLGFDLFELFRSH